VAADEPAKGPSVDERLALLEQIERREAGAVRRAARVAWLSLALAAALVAVLIFGAWWQVRELRTEASTLEAEQQTLEGAIEKQRTELAQLEAEVKEKQAAVSTMISAFRRTNERTQSGFTTALDADPKSTVLVPRAYVHIVDQDDRQWARNLSDRLESAGVIPLGIDHVPRAAGLRGFQVRYYKKSEEAGAQRIVNAMEEAGVPASPVYLDLEGNTRVRANHYEIWCPANARQFKLRPLTPPGE
jgi:cell division protein FtsL